MICDRAAFTKQNIPILQEKHIKYLGPFAAAEKEFILSIDEEKFSPIDYVTSKGRHGYFGVEKTLSFDYRGKTYITRALVVKSEEKAMLAAKTREKHMAKITAGLDHIRSKLNTRKYKKLDYVKQQIDKLFSRKKRYRSIYNIELSGSDGNLTLNWAINEEYLRQEKRADGKYILVTNLPEEEYPSSVLLQLYKSRHLNESRFRAFKSDLKVRPVFLKTDDRIKALLFINILALTVYCLVEWLCRKNNIYITARVALRKLRKIKLVEFHMSDGKKIVQLANVDEEVKKFFSVMGVKLPYT
jgi:transposase